MKLINGKAIAQNILDELKVQIQSLSSSPKLAVIQVGQDKVSNIYVARKLKDAEYTGIETENIHLEQSTSDEIKELISNLNQNSDIHGFFIQLPFPVDGEIYNLFNLISPLKDVDGLNAVNLGKIWQSNKYAFYPATVLGVLECLKYVSSNQEKQDLDDYLKGKNVLVINHSVIVGKPLAGYLVSQDATVTIAHKFTKDLEILCQKADIIVSATGKKDLIKSDMVKDGTVLVDVGISRTEEGIFGDIDQDSFESRDVWLTPVPDGVGPLTRAMLLSNTLKAYKLQHGAQIRNL